MQKTRLVGFWSRYDANYKDGVMVYGDGEGYGYGFGNGTGNGGGYEDNRGCVDSDSFQNYVGGYGYGDAFGYGRGYGYGCGTVGSARNGRR